MKYKIFTNANPPFEGKKIAIDVTKVQSIFQDVMKSDEGKHTTLWSKENNWTVSGIEPNADARSIANQKTGNSVFDIEQLNNFEFFKISAT